MGVKKSTKLVDEDNSQTEPVKTKKRPKSESAVESTSSNKRRKSTNATTSKLGQDGDIVSKQEQKSVSSKSSKDLKTNSNGSVKVVMEAFTLSTKDNLKNQTIVGSGDYSKLVRQKSSMRASKRRPWRDRVRKLAKKKGLQADRGVVESLPPVAMLTPGETVTSSEDGKKKKKRKRPKKFETDSAPAKIQLDSSTSLPSKEESIQRLEGARFRFINEQLYTMSGKEAVELFKEDPDAFQHYHEGYRSQVKKWPRNPLDLIIEWLKRKPAGLVVADMGCGEAKLAMSLQDQMTVHSFDLVAVNKWVTACDMVKVPLENGSVDICVFCLSLMGTNLNEYLREANRILKIEGILKIAEVVSRFSSVKSFIHAIDRMGFEFVAKKLHSDFFIVFEFVKKGKVVQKRPLGLKLNPCLYKKR